MRCIDVGAYSWQPWQDGQDLARCWRLITSISTHSRVPRRRLHTAPSPSRLWQSTASRAVKYLQPAAVIAACRCRQGKDSRMGAVITCRVFYRRAGRCKHWCDCKRASGCRPAARNAIATIWRSIVNLLAATTTAEAKASERRCCSYHAVTGFAVSPPLWRYGVPGRLGKLKALQGVAIARIAARIAEY